ncbi:MAG: sugar ABC transporter permease [Chloroflexota bacterium]|nr:sugar ABC transporter permease [Chloroflexota bacterium]
MYKNSRAGKFFLLPGVIWILAFTIFPLIFSLVISFTNYRLGRAAEFNNLGSYGRIFTDARVPETVTTSLFITTCSLILTMLMGVGIAWLFNHDIPGLRIFRSVMTMPLFAAPIALGFLGLILFNETSGSINSMLRGIGLEGGAWFIEPWWARFAIVLIDTWQWTPFVFIVVLAAMQSIPQELIEAAKLDTASSWLLFRKITLPLIAPALGTVAMLRLVETFKVLDIPLSMLGGGPGAATQTYAYYIYITGLKDFQLGYASALSYLLVIICIVISTIYFRRMRSRYEVK